MQELIARLASGQLGPVSLLAALACLVAAVVLSMAGGALAGTRLAGKDLGNELAAMMGALFGPTAAVPAVLIGLIVLALL